MPLVDKEAYRAYMNAYHHRKYYKRLEDSIAKLGGKCVKCGAQDALQFVNTEPVRPVNIAKILVRSEARFKEAIAKCSLMCDTCASLKVRLESDSTLHGTL